MTCSCIFLGNSLTPLFQSKKKITSTITPGVLCQVDFKIKITDQWSEILTFLNLEWLCKNLWTISLMMWFLPTLGQSTAYKDGLASTYIRYLKKEQCYFMTLLFWIMPILGYPYESLVDRPTLFLKLFLVGNWFQVLNWLTRPISIPSFFLTPL